MSLKTISSFVETLINPLANWISEKVAARMGDSASPARQVVIKSLAFILLLIPVTLVMISLIGMVIFSMQMIRASL